MLPELGLLGKGHEAQKLLDEDRKNGYLVKRGKNG